MNRVDLIGNLGNSPELRYTSAGTPVCNFNIATDEHFKDKDGNLQKRTEWHRIVIWGKAAEACEKHLAKGRQVFICGQLRTRSWDDKDGNKRVTTEIHSTDVKFLGGAPRKQGEQAPETDVGTNEPTPSDEPFPS